MSFIGSSSLFQQHNSATIVRNLLLWFRSPALHLLHHVIFANDIHISHLEMWFKLNLIDSTLAFKNDTTYWRKYRVHVSKEVCNIFLQVFSLLYVHLFGWVLWHINHCWLFNAKSCLYIYIRYIWFGFVGFYGISTIIGYLMLNPFYTYKF